MPLGQKQTIHTLRQMTLEETYELTDAITDENWKELRKNWAICYYIFVYSKIGSEQQQFNITEVIEGISKNSLTGIRIFMVM